jgi:hypothetical protein
MDLHEEYSNKLEIFQTETSLDDNQMVNVSINLLAMLAVDIWRITTRAKSEQSSERTLAACERAEERLEKIGVEIVDLQGQSYDTNMRAHVVESNGGDTQMIVECCLSPAIFFQNILVREAEIVIKGACE